MRRLSNTPKSKRKGVFFYAHAGNLKKVRYKADLQERISTPPVADAGS